MNAKFVLAASLLMLSACASNAALAQGGGGAERQDRFARMQEMADAFHATTDETERSALMREHMALMREQLDEAGGMMGPGTMDRPDTPAGDDDAEMRAMHEHMSMMHQMMMGMMAQQGMMMDMQVGEESETDDAVE